MFVTGVQTCALPIWLVGIGKNEDVPLAMPATNDNAMTRLGVSGGTISIGALYYF